MTGIGFDRPLYSLPFDKVLNARQSPQRRITCAWESQPIMVASL